jgi:hypothetical protein
MAVRMLCRVMTSPQRRRIAVMLAACLVALAATACGSSSTTKQSVIARGNAICSSALHSVHAVLPPAKGTASGSALGGYFKRLEPIVSNEVSQLRKLPRAGTDEALENRYINSVTEAGNVYKQLASAAERDDLAGVARYLSALRAGPTQSLARRYGMSQCAAAARAASP